ncbi:hypothetical protein HOV93_09950 [Planctomycetes bacterium FF15]|uniref:Microcystin LR degradation protein MlrC N-terminal domain-containing protein n=1 Tax=Bremerella alba TaxID=980252 RepID=A0A7V9A615_9BACT|nr:hypothetical protein [Bremerella alba]
MGIGLVALLHESNTFAADRTTLENFQPDILVSGPEVLARLASAHHEMGGFIQGLRESGAEPVGVFAARALPSGAITAETFDYLTQQILLQFEQAGPLDGILVAPHGATVAENDPEADGAWLTELRKRVGPEMPIMGTLDPHANLSPAMVAATNALLAYQTNPHVDQQQRGCQAAQLMVRTLRGEITPVQTAASLRSRSVSNASVRKNRQPASSWPKWNARVKATRYWVPASFTAFLMPTYRKWGRPCSALPTTTPHSPSQWPMSSPKPYGSAERKRWGLLGYFDGRTKIPGTGRSSLPA